MRKCPNLEPLPSFLGVRPNLPPFAGGLPWPLLLSSQTVKVAGGTEGFPLPAPLLERAFFVELCEGGCVEAPRVFEVRGVKDMPSGIGKNRVPSRSCRCLITEGADWRGRMTCSFHHW